MDSGVMGSGQPERRSHLFTVRLWQEELSDGQLEWRGKVQLLGENQVRYFRDWAALIPLLLSMLRNAGRAAAETQSDSQENGIK